MDEEFETEDIIRWMYDCYNYAQDHYSDNQRECVEAMLKALPKRLMPKGYRWPHFKGGRQVRIGDRYLTRDGSDRVESILFEMGGFFCNYAGDLKKPYVNRRVNGDEALLMADYEYQEGETLLEAVQIAYKKMKPELNEMENELDDKHYDILHRLRKLFEELEEL